MTLEFAEYIPEGDIDSLVILLHGYGADKHDLMSIGKHLSYSLPNTAFVSPDGLFDCDIGFGKQWFSINSMDKDEILDGLEMCSPYVKEFIDSQKSRFKLSSDRVCLVGFSQGSMLSMHLGLRMSEQLCGLVCFSGLLAGSDILKQEIKSRPPVLLIHGEKDSVVDSDFMLLASEALIENKCEVDTLLCSDLEHGIDNQGIIKASLFLQKILQVKS